MTLHNQYSYVYKVHTNLVLNKLNQMKLHDKMNVIGIESNGWDQLHSCQEL